MADAITNNNGTPYELLHAGSQIALKSDVWSDLSVEQIVQKILDLFGLDIPNWESIAANFDDLRAAFEGTYTGSEAGLISIQNMIKSLRGGLTGLIDMSRIPQLSLAQLTNQPGPNLLTGFGSFSSAETMDAPGWEWDGSVGGGSAKTTADSTRKVLTTEEFAVAEGQALTVSGVARYSGLAGSGTKMKLLVVPFIGGTAQPEVMIGAGVTGTGNNSTGQTISGAWTVSAGVTGVRVRISVEPTASAGTVWWDDVTLRKTATSLPQQWVDGLLDKFDDFTDDIAAATAWIKDLIEKLTGQARTSIEDAIADALAFGDQLKTILSGGTVSSPLPNLMGAVVGTQQTVLNQIGELFDGGSVTPVNSVVQAVKDGLAGLNAGISGATNSAVQAVVDGMNGIGSFAAAIVAAINAAIQDFLNSIFGDGGTRWGQEVYVAAGPVAVGFNDVPLGFGMPFGGKINEFMFYSSDHLSNGSGTKVVVEIRRNGTAIHTYTWAGGSNSGSVSGLNLTVVKGDRITFYVTEATSLMANMSISVLGKYT